MPRPTALLAIGAESWQLAMPGQAILTILVTGLEPVQAIALLRDRLAEQGGQVSTVCLGLPAQWVLVSPIATVDLPRRQRSAAMLYRLEEALPIEAEQLTAAFVEYSPSAALGLAVQTRQVAPVLEALEAAGIEVPAVCATDLLSAWAHAHDGQTPADYLVLIAESAAQVIRLVGGKPAAWYSCPADSEQILQSLRVDQMLMPVESQGPRVVCLGEVPPGLEHLLVGQGYQVRVEGARPMELAATAAARTAAGQAGWASFRTGSLAQTRVGRQVGRLARVAVAAGVVLVVALSASLLARGLRYQSAARQGLRQQERLFAQAFGAQRPPPNIPSRLHSELVRLEGISGRSDLPATASALDTLRQIVSAVPASLRVRVTDLQVTPTLVHLEGQSRSHGDAEALAAAMRSADVTIDSPRTELLSGAGVGFVITGQPARKETLP